MELPPIRTECALPHVRNSSIDEECTPPSPFKPMTHIAFKKKVTVMPSLFQSKLESKLRQNKLYDVILAAEHKIIASRNKTTAHCWQVQNDTTTISGLALAKSSAVTAASHSNDNNKKENQNDNCLTNRIKGKMYYTNHLRPLSPLSPKKTMESALLSNVSQYVHNKPEISYVERFQLNCEQQRMFHQWERQKRQQLSANEQLSYTKITVQFMQTLPGLISAYTGVNQLSSHVKDLTSAMSSLEKENNTRQFISEIEERTQASLKEARRSEELRSQIQAIMPMYEERRAQILREEQLEWSNLVEWEHTHHPYGPGCFEITKTRKSVDHNEMEKENVTNQHANEEIRKQNQIKHNAPSKVTEHFLSNLRNKTCLPIAKFDFIQSEQDRSQQMYKSSEQQEEEELEYEKSLVQCGRLRLQRVKTLAEESRLHANAIGELVNQESFDREMIINEESVEWIPLLESNVDSCYEIMELQRKKMQINDLCQKEVVNMREGSDNCAADNLEFYHEMHLQQEDDTMHDMTNDNTAIRQVNQMKNTNNIENKDINLVVCSNCNDYAFDSQNSQARSSIAQNFTPEYLRNILWYDYVCKEHLLTLFDLHKTMLPAPYRSVVLAMIDEYVRLVEQQMSEIWNLYISAGTEASVLTDTEPGSMFYHGLQMDSLLLDYETMAPPLLTSECSEECKNDSALKTSLLMNKKVGNIVYSKHNFDIYEDARVVEMLL